MVPTKRSFLLVLALSFGWASLSAAEEGASPPVEKNNIAAEATQSEQEPMSTSETKIDGIVQAVDMRNHSVQIKDKTGGMTTIVVRSDTQIRRNGKLVRLGRLKAGNVVAIKNPS